MPALLGRTLVDADERLGAPAVVVIGLWGVGKIVLVNSKIVLT